jgi:DNA-binding SARP family transcriptional activator
MEFQVLGSLHARTERGPLRLSGDRQRRLLAALLIDFDRAVPMSHLVDVLWEDAPPPTARRQIQNSISALRREVTALDTSTPFIVGDRSGYQVPNEAGQLDARVFDQRVARARQLAGAGLPAQAVTELRAGLDLWRGTAFQSLTGQVIEAAAARLNEQRLAAVEECLELELRLGRYRESIAELTELVAAHPLRERLVSQLMLALYWSGRQADALQAYHSLRTRLAAELAIDPGASIRDLYLEILNNDPAVGAPDGGRGAALRAVAPPVPAQLPADVADFAGRADQLAALDRTAPITVITGMAGMGKTALAVHWAHRARDRFPDGQLYVDLRGFDPTGCAVTPAQAVKGFLDAFAVPPDRIPASPDAQAGLYRSLLAGQRVLVVLDNARDADHVRALLPGSPTCQVVVTSRNYLSGLVAGAGARPLDLGLLPAGEARDLLARRSGRRRVAAEPAATDEIIARCAGLPLALAIVAGRAASNTGLPLAALAGELRDGHGGLDALDGEDVATDVRAVFSWSYRALSAPAARLFRLLALHPGPDISAAAAASLIGRAAGSPRRALAELVAAHLITEHAPRRYALHDLLRAYATELVQRVDDEATRRAAVHRMLDHYLHTAHAAARLEHPQRHPVTLAPPHPDAVPETFASPAQAVAWFTSEHRVVLACLAQAARTGFDGHVWQLAWSVAEFLDRRGHWHDWVATQRDALRAARRIADQAGQAHAHRALGRAYLRMDRTDTALPHLRQAYDMFGLLGERVAQARTHLDLGWAYDRRRRYRQALDHAEQALDLFRAAGHAPGEADALNAVGSYSARLGDHHKALGDCQRALTLHRDVGYRRGQADTWVRLGDSHLQLGDHSHAATCYEYALDLFRKIGVRYEEANALASLGDTHHAAGDVDRARRTWQQALTILTDLRHADADRVGARLRRYA